MLQYQSLYFFSYYCNLSKSIRSDSDNLQLQNQVIPRSQPEPLNIYPENYNQVFGEQTGKMGHGQFMAWEGQSCFDGGTPNKDDQLNQQFEQLCLQTKSSQQQQFTEGHHSEAFDNNSYMNIPKQNQCQLISSSDIQKTCWNQQLILENYNIKNRNEQVMPNSVEGNRINDINCQLLQNNQLIPCSVSAAQLGPFPLNSQKDPGNVTLNEHLRRQNEKSIRDVLYLQRGADDIGSKQATNQMGACCQQRIKISQEDIKQLLDINGRINEIQKSQVSLLHNQLSQQSNECVNQQIMCLLNEQQRLQHLFDQKISQQTDTQQTNLFLKQFQNINESSLIQNQWPYDTGNLCQYQQEMQKSHENMESSNYFDVHWFNVKQQLQSPEEIQKYVERVNAIVKAQNQPASLQQSAEVAVKGSSKPLNPDAPDALKYQIGALNQVPNSKITLDIVNPCIFECSIDQQCSRFIQERLRNTKNEKETEEFIQRLITDQTIDLKQLMMDQNGNYIVQLVLQHRGPITQVCHKIMYAIVLENIYQLSIHRNGCRVVQTSFDVFPENWQTVMINRLILPNKIRECSFDFNGNHVIQKILINIKQLQSNELYSRFILEIENNVLDYSMHEYCCRIVQRLIENCSQALIFSLIERILEKYDILIRDQYGTFVLCSILESGDVNQQMFLIEKVSLNMHQMSLDRDGSKLLENCIKMVGQPEYNSIQNCLRQILTTFIGTPTKLQNCKQQKNDLKSQDDLVEPSNCHKFNDSRVSFNEILVSKYGNYVMQTAIDRVRSEDELKQNHEKKILQKIKQTVVFLGPEKCKQLPIKHVLQHLLKLNIDLNQVQTKSVSEKAETYRMGPSNNNRKSQKHTPSSCKKTSGKHHHIKKQSVGYGFNFDHKEVNERHFNSGIYQHHEGALDFNMDFAGSRMPMHPHSSFKNSFPSGEHRHGPLRHAPPPNFQKTKSYPQSTQQPPFQHQDPNPHQTPQKHHQHYSQHPHHHFPKKCLGTSLQQHYPQAPVPSTCTPRGPQPKYQNVYKTANSKTSWAGDARADWGSKEHESSMNLFQLGSNDPFHSMQHGVRCFGATSHSEQKAYNNWEQYSYEDERAAGGGSSSSSAGVRGQRRGGWTQQNAHRFHARHHH